MSSPPQATSLDQFICEMRSEPVRALAHERFMAMARRLELSEQLVEHHIRWADDHYARNLVCRTPAFELLVLCWRPGQASTIHDHAGSLNAIRVHRGLLTSRLYAPAASAAPGDGPVRLTREETVAAGAWTGLDRGGIHQLANTSAEDLVTVHLYAPPLRELVVYSTERPGTERLTLRYTLSDDLE